MAYNSTSWTADGLTKATNSTSTDDSLSIDGTLTVGGASTLSSTLTIGVNDTGYDVKFFGATSGSFMLWDESDDALELTDSSPIKIGDGGDMTIYHDGSHSYVTNATGTMKIATESSGIAVSIGHTTSETTVNDNLTVSGDLDIDGTTNLDAVDIDGATQIDGTVTVGVDDTGYDVKFFGAASGKYMLWDASIDSLELTDSTPLNIGAGKDMVIYHSGTHSYINNSTGTLNIATSESGIPVSIGHTTSETTVNDNLTITGDTKMTSGSKLFFDGTITTSGGTYITESSANVLDFYAGGVNSLRVDDDQVIVGTSQVHFTASSGTEMHWSADGAANLRALGGMYINTGTATGTPLKLGTNGQTDSLVIDSS